VALASPRPFAAFNPYYFLLALGRHFCRFACPFDASRKRTALKRLKKVHFFQSFCIFERNHKPEANLRRNRRIFERKRQLVRKDGSGSFRGVKRNETRLAAKRRQAVGGTVAAGTDMAYFKQKRCFFV
jgi:hypothetical protein